MVKTPRKRNINMALKLAIVSSKRKSRDVATRASMGEVRLSAIIHGRGSEATIEEQRALARVLRRPRAALFPKPQSEAVAS